jgi:hypothetical protein
MKGGEIFMKFPLGQVVITPGAMEILPPQEVSVALSRHSNCDWGDLCEEDKQENEFSLKIGLRLMSSYKTGNVKFWIITEADRSATTILLPDEY